jgi:small subunit ribosomal protein S13
LEEYRILDVNIKPIGVACMKLSKIYGLGKQRSTYILDLFGYGRNVKMQEINRYGKDCLRIFITGYTYLLEGPLKFYVRQNLDFLVGAWVYRGARFLFKLPMRGQRSATNARSIKRYASLYGKQVKKPVKAYIKKKKK